MRRLVPLGLLAALPLVAVPLVWAAASGGSSGATLAEFRDVSRPVASTSPQRPLVALRATPRRISVAVSRPGGVVVRIGAEGRVVRTLGHFSLAGPQRLVLSWDGRDDAGRPLPAGRYVASASVAGYKARAPFQVRRLPDADDADRQPLREQGDA